MASRTTRRAGYQPLRPTRLADPTTHRHVETIRRAVDDLQRAPILAARELGPITLAEGETRRIPHGLGRALKRWERIDLVVDDSVSSAGTIVRITNAGGSVADDTKEIVLKAFGWGTDAEVTFKVRVY